MTITDTPTHRAEPDDAQVLFEEAKQRRKRRRLLSGIAIVVMMALGLTVGLWASHSSSDSPRPHSTKAPAPAPAAVTGFNFSMRPVLCYAPAYSTTPGQVRPTRPLPTCSSPFQLTASNLQIDPAANNVNGYVSNPNIGADPQFAAYPSTISSNDLLNQDVLLSGTSATGATNRYVLGPAGLTRSSIASAQAKNESGQWVIILTLTSRGATQWDTLAAQQFHAIIGVVINGQVVSAPITQPTQSSFTSFRGQVGISGGFTEHQAKVIASEL